MLWVETQGRQETSFRPIRHVNTGREEGPAEEDKGRLRPPHGRGRMAEETKDGRSRTGKYHQMT